MPIVSPTQTFIFNESPTRINATTYQLFNLPIPNTQWVFLNGLLQKPGSTNDYTINDNIITFTSSIDASDTVLVNYMIEVVSSSSSLTVGGEWTRKDLIHWCLRKLGSPVIDINVDESQIEDRIDEALMYFRDYHFDGVERVYLHHQITASVMVLAAPLTEALANGSIITGTTSGAIAYVYDMPEALNKIRYTTANEKTFLPGEPITVTDSTVTFEILNSPTAITIGNVDCKYINIGEKPISITNILPQQSATIGGNYGGMFDFQYQFSLNNMFNLASTDLITYDIYKQYISLWEFMFRGQRGIRFNRKTDRLYVDLQDWTIDQWLVIEAWVALDPEVYNEIYSDEFVREYAYSLIKQQWGANLKKFSGITLPGGTTLNGQQIYDEAKTEIDTLRERVRKEFELPTDFLVG